MRGFVVYGTYREEGKQTKVHLFGRLEDGRSFQTINAFEPYFFVPRAKDSAFSAISTQIPYRLEQSERKDFAGQPLTQVILQTPRDVPTLRGLLQERGVECLEADIRFVQRFLIDKDIRGCVSIEGVERKGERVDTVFNEPQLGPAEYVPSIRTLSLDIETDGNAKTVYSISLHGENISEVHIVSAQPVEGAHAHPDEPALLRSVLARIVALDPDLLAGWNFIDFDIKVLSERCSALGVPFDLARVPGWRSNVRLQREFMRDSEADIPGRLALDGIALLKASFVRLEDYKLETAGQTLLGEGKSVSFGDKRAEIEKMFREDKKKLAEYNLKDAILVYRILKEKGIIDLTLARSKLTGMLPDRVKASVASLDSLYLRETLKRGIVCRSTAVREREERIKGGFVMDSTPGMYSWVSVFDFKSLYPSIIRTFNIDPLSFDPNGTIIAPNGAHFRNEEGILPLLIERLWAQRDLAKKRKDAAASLAIKITMNSFFGVLANPACRFYSLEMGNAITSFGQKIIKDAARLLRDQGEEVIYGDTDSVFVHLQTTDLESAAARSKELVSHVNSYFTAAIPRDYNRPSQLELQYEKTFIKFLLPRIRGTDVGSKKRYAGLLIKDGKEKIVFTGLESVRRDWTDAAKKLQLELVERAFHNQDLRAYIRSFVNDIRAGLMDDALVYRKQLRKDEREYTKTTPPHVKAARQLERIDTPIISYYLTVDGPQPLEKLRSRIDYDHYIDKQIRPIANAILSFRNESFDDIMANSKQKTLFGF